jgi:hypothetical protein
MKLGSSTGSRSYPTCVLQLVACEAGKQLGILHLMPYKLLAKASCDCLQPMTCICTLSVHVCRAVHICCTAGAAGWSGPAVAAGA